MGVLSNNYAQIIPGALISASYVSDIYDVLLGTEPETLKITGSLTVTGSVTVSNGIYGTLYGNASTSTSASYAVTSSYIAATSLRITPSNPLPSNVQIGSFAVSSSTPPKPYFWDGTNWNALY